MTRILADLLIPGRGAPVRNGCVVLEGDRIAYAGPAASAPAAADSAEAVRVTCCMPGLWECHGHFIGMVPAEGTFPVHLPAQVMAARAVKDVEAVLAAGFTSVREVGGIGCELARVVDEGIIDGPTIYGAGALLSTTGGHGDLHHLPHDWVEWYCEQAGSFTHLCDGVPACLKAVRLQLRRGARLIKVCASGGVMSQLDDPVHQQFSGEELRAIVEEAARAEVVVAAHCHGKPGIMAALKAGCRTIEHGSYLDEEAAAAMREADAILVPTRFIVDRLRRVTTGMLPESIRKMQAIADRHAEAVALAISSGVRIALGTDITTSARKRGGVPWGHNGQELALLVSLGMTPLQAIEAATATAPDTLGPQAPRSGQLAAGFDADLIAVAASPLEDISVLGRPALITHVWKRGRLVVSRAATGDGPTFAERS